MHELRRKIGCDAERPICRQCRLRPPRSLTPCKYSHAPPAPQLEEPVEAMQEGINALEASTGQDPSQIFLSKPYVSSQQLSATSTPVPKFIEEHVPQLTGTLVDTFLHRFAGDQFFFFDSSVFHRTASLCLPFGHHDHLSSGLSYVVYLWANRLSPADGGQAEAKALILAVNHLASDIAGIQQHPHRILQIIQAAVLLSLYYLDAGYLSEGKYHCAGATSLALTAGLHRIGSPAQISHLPFAFPGVALAVPPDTTRSKEMIDAFWSVVILNNYWVAASGITSSISSEVLISTPYPTDNSILGLPSAVAVPESDPHGLSSLALLVQASIILDRSIACVAGDPGLDKPHPPEFWALDRGLITFSDSLPGTSIEGDQCTLITHALVNVAILRLHAPRSHLCNKAQFKCFAAAAAILSRFEGASIATWEHVDPILGPLLSTISDFYISQLPLVPNASAELQRAFLIMDSLARLSPLAQQCLAATRMRYDFAQLYELPQL
ncbi:hypothetical protein B0H11DRAFT_67965 [Mycena galericulata]|nr:hypothetical protein B0H11DRAFT_67965 [Mycena galericulata]